MGIDRDSACLSLVDCFEATSFLVSAGVGFDETVANKKAAAINTKQGIFFGFIILFVFDTGFFRRQQSTDE